MSKVEQIAAELDQLTLLEAAQLGCDLLDLAHVLPPPL